MNIGIVTSYLVAGIILLSIIMMNVSLSNSSTELTLTNMKRQHMSGITQTITSDFNKMGYNLTELLDPIFLAADSNRISFRSNIDNSSDGSVETVTWTLTTTEDSNSENPNDYILTRSVDGNTMEIKQGVTRFSLRYYDTYGAPLNNNMAMPVSSSDFDQIRQIKVLIELQSKEMINTNTSGSSYYVKTFWEKRLSPPNLDN
ncbi:MAG: hypothetical protein U5J95_05615 [Balneolaceae bacterium]|nr:hypothetical protein [Balneolaceae bacterium]